MGSLVSKSWNESLCHTQFVWGVADLTLFHIFLVFEILTQSNHKNLTHFGKGFASYFVMMILFWSYFETTFIIFALNSNFKSKDMLETCQNIHTSEENFIWPDTFNDVIISISSIVPRSRDWTRTLLVKTEGVNHYTIAVKEKWQKAVLHILKRFDAFLKIYTSHQQ